MTRRPLEFGYTLAGNSGSPLLEIAREADRLGLDLIGVMDHPYQHRDVETWTLLSMIAAVTSRIRVFPNVACTPLRPPALLAKSAASLDLLSGGRAELGLGAGSVWDGIEAFGGTRRTTAEARAVLDEVIGVIRLMWSGGRGLRFDGEHHRLRGADSGPVPAHAMEIWLGVGGPRAVELVGRAADGWLPSLGPLPKERLPELQARLDDAAAGAGRDPAAIRRLLNLSGLIDSDEPAFLTGSVRDWTGRLAELAVEYGIDTFLFWPATGDQHRQLRLYAEEVVPAVREQVGTA